MPKPKQNYSDSLKKQIVELRKDGSSASELAKEYGIAKSTVIKWCNDFTNTGSFKAKDNRTDEENELIALRKQNKQLLMENYILKQASLTSSNQIELVLANAKKHNISAMCKLLGISRSNVYYQKKKRIIYNKKTKQFCEPHLQK